MRLVQMSDYTVGGDCFQTIPVVLGRYHARKAALVGSAPSLAAAAPQIEEVIDAFPIESLGTIDYGTHCTQGAIDALLKNSAFSAAEVAIAIGGGAKSPLWLQVKADITGKKYYSAEVPEATMMGSAMLLLLALGKGVEALPAIHIKQEFQPDREAEAIYRKCYQGYMERHELVKKLYEM